MPRQTRPAKTTALVPTSAANSAANSAASLPAFDYEAVALRGDLNEIEERALIEAFAQDSDVTAIATRLGLPKEIVHNALSDRRIVSRALQIKQATAGLRFFSTVFDSLQRIIDDPNPLISTMDKMRAVKAMRELLQLRLDTEESVVKDDAPTVDKGTGSFTLEQLLRAAHSAQQEEPIDVTARVVPSVDVPEMAKKIGNNVARLSEGLRALAKKPE